MKKLLTQRILRGIFIGISFLPWLICNSHGQSIWPNISLTGAEAKILNVLPRYTVQAGVKLALQRPDPIQKDPVALQEMMNDPALFEQLFERLGGEFFIGEISGPTTENINQTGRIHPMPGIKGGIRLGRNFEMQGSVYFFTTEWSGQFPLVVFPNDGSMPIQHTVTLTQSTRGSLFQLSMVAYLTMDRIRPYLQTGLRYQHIYSQKAAFEFSDFQVPYDDYQLKVEQQPFAGAGLRGMITGKTFIDLGLTYGKLPGSSWALAADASIGINF